MRANVTCLVSVLLQTMSSALCADAPKAPTSSPRSRALILDVPYVSWSEAAQWRYERKDIVNPSYVATLKMVRRYWDQDRPKLFQFGAEEYAPEHWKSGMQAERAQRLEDLKAWIARGVPLAVALPLTPGAHPICFPALALFTAKALKLPEEAVAPLRQGD